MSAILAKAEGRFSETAIDDEVVVMSLESGDFFSLTGTAKAIWLLIDGTRSRDTLLADLASQFSARPDAIASEVDAFLGQLTEAGLLAAA